MSNVNHPAHYQGKYECIDEMVVLFGVEAVVSFCKLNAYKYRFRAAAKGGPEDLDKAAWYVGKAAELQGVELRTAEHKRAAERTRVCYNCKHEFVAMEEEPCASCYHRPLYPNFTPKED